MRRSAVTVAAVVLALIEPAVAMAHRQPTYLAPPGNSALTQYLEVVPTAAGPAPPRAGGGSPGAGGGSGGTLSARAVAKLAHLGSEGKLLVSVVGATAPTAQAGASEPPGSAQGGATSPSPAGQLPRASQLSGAGAASPVSSLLVAATGRDGGGGVGFLLPLLMAAVFAVVVFVVVRRRTARGS
jgi:hypothetical protein